MFLDARYFSSSEACWRVFKFAMHERTPNVVKLAVHLEGQHVSPLPIGLHLSSSSLLLTHLAITAILSSHALRQAILLSEEGWQITV